MAFTEDQNVKIRMYLGYPDVYRQINPRLENAITVIGSRPATQAVVEDILTQLDNISGVSVPAALLTAGLKKAEDIEWYQGGQITDTFKLGRQLCGRLSNIFGVFLGSDAFGTGGYIGDEWKLHNGNSGPIPLG